MITMVNGRGWQRMTPRTGHQSMMGRAKTESEGKDPRSRFFLLRDERGLAASVATLRRRRASSIRTVRLWPLRMLSARTAGLARL